MALTMPGPSAPTIAMARMSPGTDRNTSVTRMMTSCTQPPTYPAIMPSGTPMSIATPVTMSAIWRVTRAPTTTRVKMSLPTSSVPNQCTESGGWSLRSMCTAPAASSGNGTNHGPTAAVSRNAATMPSPSIADPLRAKVRP